MCGFIGKFIEIDYKTKEFIMSDTQSAYSELEQADLEYLKQVRMDVIKSMTADGLPVKSGDIRVLNELISSGEKSIHDTVSNKLKFQDNQSKDAMNDIVATALLQLQKNGVHREAGGEREICLEDSYIPTDIVPGELSQEVEELEVSDFIEE